MRDARRTRSIRFSFMWSWMKGPMGQRGENATTAFLIESLESRQLLAAAGTSPANIIAYFPDYEWSNWKDINISGLSEIDYFALLPGSDGSLPTTSSSGYSLNNLKTVVTAAHAASPRVAVSIVIDPGSPFLTIAQSATATATFISNIIAFSTTYNLDGIDLDYEPGSLTTAQKNTWGAFLAALHTQTAAHALILSEAVQADQMIIPKAYIGDLDRYNVMTYELEYNSSAPYSDTITYLTNWANYGVPKSKLMMGVPFYGSAGTSWSNYTDDDYSLILNNYAAANGGSYPAANVDAVTINGTSWGYNGITTIQTKANYVVQNGYGGIMIWEIGEDHFTSGQYDSTSLLPPLKSSLAGLPASVVNANTLIVNGTTGGGTTNLNESGGSFTINASAGTYAVASSTVNSILFTGNGGSNLVNVTSTLNKPVNFIGNGAGRDTLNISSGTLNLQAPATGAGISPEAVGTIAIGSGAAAVLQDAASHTDRTVLMLNALTIAGSTNAWTGKLDLQWNDLVVHNGNIATLTNQIASGDNSSGTGRWTGNGLASATDAADATHRTALGVATGLTTFDGQAVATTDVLVKSTYYGDTNLDGKVDASDYSRIDNGFLQHLTGWFNGDFNYDGVINGSDYTLIDNAFNTQSASLAAQIATVAKPKAPPQRAVALFSDSQLQAAQNGWTAESNDVAATIFGTDINPQSQRRRNGARVISAELAMAPGE